MDRKRDKKDYILASDAAAWASCIRRAWLNHHHAPKAPIDEFTRLLMDMGLEHESKILTRLKKKKDVQTAQSLEHTSELMAAGTEVIYQARLRDDDKGYIGRPDFLILSDSGQYQAADAKLSLNKEKKEIQVQLSLYRKMLGNDEPATVFLGDGSEARIGNESEKHLAQFIVEMKEALAGTVEPDVRYSHSKCRACPYYEHCKPVFESREDLSLLYGIQKQAVQGLEKAGIKTISKLAGSELSAIPPDVPHLKREDKKRRAILQAKSYLTGEVFQLRDVELPEGHWVHFDVEDNPLAMIGDKHVYLWGFLVADASDGNKKENFEYVWADSKNEDREGWGKFLEQIETYRKRYADLILAHYSNHERTTIKKYANRYGMQDNETVLYLLGDDSPLFDIQKPVLDSLVLPLQGYSLKDICKHKDLVNFQWEDEDSGSQWSMVQFKRFLDEPDPKEKAILKSKILRYNRDDVTATHRLEQWLRTHFMA